MTEKAILVLDAGSSALKAAIFNGGELSARSEADYARSPSGAQNPDNWWQAALEAVRALKPENLAAIVLTGTMENLIPVGSDGDPLGDALLYSNPCGEPFLIGMAPELERAGAQGICGNAAEPLMTAFKLHWLKASAPERFAAARWFLPGSKDYFALRMTGWAVTDPICAATTGLMDFGRRDWSDSLLALHGFGRSKLPEILPATAVVGQLLEAPAKALGLPAGLPVINGCGDAGATTLGSGADQPGDISLYLGTTGWVARVGAPDVSEPKPFYRLPHPLIDAAIEIAPILSAGAAAQWARTALGLELEAAERLAGLADVNPRDVLFFPYLEGERSPFVDLDLRAGFIGVSSSTGPGDLYRAVLEGVGCAIASNIDSMGGADGRVLLAGGGARSRLWPQLLADIIGADILSPGDPVAVTGFGAYRIAAAALDLPNARHGPAVSARPRPDRRQRAEQLKRRFASGTAWLRSFS